MHYRALEHRAVIGTYRAYPTTAKSLGKTLDTLLPGTLGLNITAPLKSVVLDHCEEVSDLAMQLGAANTLVSKGGFWRAENTDAPGLLETLGGSDALTGQSVSVLGAGGAASAVIWALVQAGCSSIQVRCRSKEGFDRLSERAIAPNGALVWQPWSKEGPAVDLVINSTPLGRIDPMPISLKAQRILDLNYRPDGWTELCRQSRSVGISCADGRGLLLEQGILAQQLWFGDLPNGLREAMGNSLLK